MELKERLTQLRREHGLSQNELAEQIHVSRQAVSRWEHGTAVPSSDNLILLGELYGVSLDELIDRRKTEGQDAKAEQELPRTEEKSSHAEKHSLDQKKIGYVVVLLALLLGIAIGVIISFREGADILPMAELEKNVIDVSNAGSISGYW